MADERRTGLGLDGLKINRLMERIASLPERTSKDTDAFLHAIVDIGISVEKVYFEILPSLLDSAVLTQEELQDKLWELREEFRHIDYHIHDSNLLE